LWMRSASRAMLPLAMKMIVWATAARPSTARDNPTARRPLRERMMLLSTKAWEWPCPLSW
jgi:hypothetical protein